LFAWNYSLLIKEIPDMKLSYENKSGEVDAVRNRRQLFELLRLPPYLLLASF